jgi:hypothetical protein
MLGLYTNAHLVKKSLKFEKINRAYFLVLARSGQVILLRLEEKHGQDPIIWIKHIDQT